MGDDSRSDSAMDEQMFCVQNGHETELENVSDESRRSSLHVTADSQKTEEQSCLGRLNKWGLFCGLVLSFSLLMVGLFKLDPFIQSQIESGLVLKEGTEFFKNWVRGDPPIEYKMYLFNMTNAGAFLRGARPRLKEVGPYVYKVREYKENVVFNNDSTVTYATRSIFSFDPSRSVGSEADVIIGVNVPLVNAGDVVKSNGILQKVFNGIRDIKRFESITTLTVRELLWGHRSDVLEWAKDVSNIPYPYHDFGLMVGKNDTLQETYTIHTGESDISKIHSVIKYGGKSSLNAWSNGHCNYIHGTTGVFPPNLLPSQVLHLFNGQLCRPLPLVYRETIEFEGLQTYRYSPPDDVFSYGSNYAHNACYCQQDGACPASGTLDIGRCFYGASVALSFPHFYEADPVLRHIVQGLRPQKELHQTQFDIYPKLGVPLRVKLRMQMNVVLDGNQALQRGRHFDIVFPVFWFEAGIDSLPQDMVGMLKMAQDVPPLLKTAFVVVAASITFLFLILLLTSAFADWCGISVPSRSPTPENLPAHHWYLKNSQYLHFDGTCYKPASMNSLTPAEHYPHDGTMLPPYRKHGHVEKDAEDIFHDLPTVGDPEPFSVFPEAAKESIPSMVSVEVHTSSSETDYSREPTVLQPPREDSMGPTPNSMTDEECFSEDNHDVITAPHSFSGSPKIHEKHCHEDEEEDDTDIEKHTEDSTSCNSELSICKSTSNVSTPCEESPGIEVVDCSSLVPSCSHSSNAFLSPNAHLESDL